jgi:hypothetical protein
MLLKISQRHEENVKQRAYPVVGADVIEIVQEGINGIQENVENQQQNHDHSGLGCPGALLVFAVRLRIHFLVPSSPNRPTASRCRQNARRQALTRGWPGGSPVDLSPLSHLR